MRRLTPPAVGLLFMSVCFAFVSVSAHSGSEARHLEGWFKNGMNGRLSSVPALQAQVQALGHATTTATGTMVSAFSSAKRSAATAAPA